MNTSTTAQLGAALCSSSEVVSDTTCFVERSTVRMIMLARNDALGLKAVDELRIYTAEDFRASLQPSTGGEEPTAEMLNAHLKATGAWVEPFEAEHEGGVQISGELSQADADDINAMNRSDLRKGYAASAMAQSSETVTIDDVPSCGQENDYRRAQSSAGMADALGSLDEAKALLALAYKGGSYKSKINSALHRLTHVERLLRSPALAQGSSQPRWTEDELALAFFDYSACTERRCGWTEPGDCDCRNAARKAVHWIKHVLPRSFPLATEKK